MNPPDEQVGGLGGGRREANVPLLLAQVTNTSPLSSSSMRCGVETTFYLFLLNSNKSPTGS